jgi:hypothetical protein
MVAGIILSIWGTRNGLDQAQTAESLLLFREAADEEFSTTPFTGDSPKS